MITTNCSNCGRIFSKRKKDVLRSINNFCSHKCSAIYNNRLRPPRSIESKAKTSNTLIKLNERKQKEIKYKSNCKICSKLMEFYGKNSIRRTCSLQCKKEAELRGILQLIKNLQKSKIRVKSFYKIIHFCINRLCEDN